MYCMHIGLNISGELKEQLVASQWVHIELKCLQPCPEEMGS
jgi:hypothetical protein